MQDIVDHILQMTGVDVTLRTSSRERLLVEHRCLFFKMARDQNKWSLAEIGRFLNKDHASVLYGLKLYYIVETQLFIDTEQTYKVSDVNSELYKTIITIRNKKLKEAICRIVNTEAYQSSTVTEESYGGLE